MRMRRPIGVSGHHLTAAPTAAGTTRQTISRIDIPVHGPAIKPTTIAARKESAHITASEPPDGTKNSRTRKTRPKKSSRKAQVTASIQASGVRDQESGLSGIY